MPVDPVVDDDVRGLHQPTEHLAPLRLGDIEEHAALPTAAVQRVHHAEPRIELGERPVDLDAFRAETGQDARCGRARNDVAQVEDPQTGERETRRSREIPRITQRGVIAGRRHACGYSAVRSLADASRDELLVGAQRTRRREMSIRIAAVSDPEVWPRLEHAAVDRIIYLHDQSGLERVVARQPFLQASVRNSGDPPLREPSLPLRRRPGGESLPEQRADTPRPSALQRISVDGIPLGLRAPFRGACEGVSPRETLGDQTVPQSETLEQAFDVALVADTADEERSTIPARVACVERITQLIDLMEAQVARLTRCPTTSQLVFRVRQIATRHAMDAHGVEGSALLKGGQKRHLDDVTASGTSAVIKSH